VSRYRTFVFTFEVNNQFLRLSPVAEKYIDACQDRIAARRTATGPRGGLYELVTAPDLWLGMRNGDDAFLRDVTVFTTKRRGRYVRPDRITPNLVLGETIHFDSLTVPAVEGQAILPSGQTVTTDSPYVSFPVLVE
jgi:hypothetical protein